MAERGTDQLVAWLDDAYAMESGLVSILESHASHFSGFDDSARRIQDHIAETLRHAQRLEQCLHQLGATPSSVKSTLSSLIGGIEGSSTAIFRDQLVKDVLADYASEQFEIACYTALVSLATDLKYPEIARLCRENLQEDQAMADWLLRKLPSVVLHDASPTAYGRTA
jgi:ferritin-like metal-binding protein YciE